MQCAGGTGGGRDEQRQLLRRELELLRQIGDDIVAGNLCAFLTPDWRIATPKKDAPAVSGLMRMMPLPRFAATDAPTSTAGGTMLGITRHSERKDDAWKLIEFLYFSDSGLQARQQTSNILPPVISQWDDPTYHREDPYFGGQKVDELYIQLARQTPARTPTGPMSCGRNGRPNSGNCGRWGATGCWWATAPCARTWRG